MTLQSPMLTALMTRSAEKPTWSAYLLDSRADCADSSLQLVEVAVKTCRECGDCIVIALDCRHQQVAVVVVGHLVAESVNLSLYFGALETSIS